VRQQQLSEAILSAPASARYPIGIIRPSFHSTVWLREYAPYAPDVTTGNLRLTSPNPAYIIDPLVPLFRPISRFSRLRSAMR
jgi:hypothetical protein